MPNQPQNSALDPRSQITDHRSETSPRVSIVIVNWNSKDYVAACLRSLEKHESIGELQIIVVDGASFDGIEQLLSSEFPYVQFIQSPENVGFGRCNNLGVEKATSEFLLLLNPDTEFLAPTINKMIAWHRELPEAGILCPRLLLTDGSLQYSSVQAAPTPLNQALGSEFLQKRFPKSKLWGTYPAYHRDAPTSVEAVSGAFMFMRTETFRAVGGFNPAYFMYAEDMDLCLQVRRAGLRNYHIPDSEVVHHGGGSSSKQVSRFATLKMKEANHLYFCLNHSKCFASLYKFSQFISAIIRLCIIKPRVLISKSDSQRNSLEKWKAVLLWSFSKQN
ncbi:glycosyltransferase family 2 protein [Pelagicoccus enzymogenes]|uniref:glycosyltransferase family 2 protein n=1 Tax=Pelagicoccus enzymogenes TaxID=2773457 RepID=UPI00280F1FAE|nr:glycosyltransferase family 2 protein [Pelagicoccus enzymogenes]MDQ8201102.1 glycosyltransferase family 2 protein [Pelagicoccus enzymogenes]